MIDASNIPGREYAEYLYPLLAPLKQISVLNAEKNKISQKYKYEDKNAGRILIFFIVGVPIAMLLLLSYIYSITTFQTEMQQQIYELVYAQITMASALPSYFIVNIKGIDLVT